MSLKPITVMPDLERLERVMKEFSQMSDDLYDQADLQQLEHHNAMQERYRQTVETIQRVAQAGAKEEDIKTLCRETGVNVKDVIVEPRNAADR